MNLSAPFIKRPIGTTLLALGIALAGIVAFNLLPVASLPQIEFPTISVQANLPGASPETMATSVATPLERQLGRIAGITDMTSSSNLGNTQITIQFDLSRNIDGAARDVQAAINAARAQLPTDLPNNPTYRKINPADAPIMILALTSNTYTPGQMYDAASTILLQKLSQLDGVGQVNVGGGSLPAVRVELNPTTLNKYGISLDQVRTTLDNANANRPKGQIANNSTTSEIITNDQLFKAYQYKPLIIAYRNNQAVRVSDVAEVNDSVENILNAGLANGKPSIVIIIRKQPGANVINTVDHIREMLPQLRASIPAAINITVTMDRSVTIRASLHDVEITLLIATILVILVTFLFLGNLRSMLIPGVAVPLSLLGTFAIMYLLGYTLNNLSLMALTISTGFVIDDAIVMLENITRHIEMGVAPIQAAFEGAKEVAFTVVSMSFSLIAVFIPILLMTGIAGRLFREFAVTLSVAILVSLLISLTVTPMMCSRLLKLKDQPKESLPQIPSSEKPQSRRERRRGDRPVALTIFCALCGSAVKKFSSNVWFDKMHKGYEKSLAWALNHSKFMLLLTLAAIAFNIYLFIIIPKGFFPQQDTGRIIGTIQADQNISFQSIKQKLTAYVNIVKQDPAVAHVVGYVGGNTAANSGFVFISLKPFSERDAIADAVINRLRPKLAAVTGSNLYLQAAQDLVIGGRFGASQFQYTLSADNLRELNMWSPRVLAALYKLPGIVDINSDQLDHALQVYVNVDRDTAARFGITSQQIDDTLYNAFGQRQVSTMYTAMNQYHVVMELAPEFWQYPQTLKDIYVVSPNGQAVPLSAFASFATSSTLLSVNHQGQAPAATLSFNLLPGIALGDAVVSVEKIVAKLKLPESIHGTFKGTAEAFQASLATEPYLILLALITVYIVLGMLYESYIHPITILSTLPSAGVGAFLALLLMRIEFSIIALIGIILLIGIVKKNAIMMIDFALHVERTEKKSPQESIYQGALLRFRPIMMTTMAAMLGALPLAIGFGIGSEMRRPLGVAIIGGLILSQLLTLYTTPVIYLALEKCKDWYRPQKTEHSALNEIF